MKLFITGIGTDVGKTIASSIIVESLQADYWKPVQAGDLDNSDSHKIQSYISNSSTVIHENSYKLTTPASPHLAAKLDQIIIDIQLIVEPKTANHLVIEGAGGLLVPLNNSDYIIDLIKDDYKVIVVSRHYLGSINHTLLTLEALRSRNIPVAGIVFSGDEYPSSEEIILSKSNAKFIGRIENEPYFDQNVIQYYADKFREPLQSL
ncbi:dethiobiotin synthase [Flavobacterium ammonificans]|uniref:ATP-dependent dethiobiotin synthetase BioD n=1 Tax=Flavobacterium ammonificans TaxID=1751056 RepID=A0ABM7UY37_9FLAO|nr:dethiobiotin synthase [Flavobacterium ammonificans]BDB52395.1 ATP-dependent dethiobiotin synthetase BioD [Flavobacterium ammonificans]